MSTHGIKSDAGKQRANATENKRQPRAALAGFPGQEVNRTYAYHAEDHKFTEQESHRETERVPSAGWRAVYQAMGGGWP